MTRPLLVALVMSSSFAWAQQQAVAPPPPPPPPPAEAYAAPPPPPPDVPQQEEGGRIRWGANARIGAFLPYTSVVFGVEGRVGYQFSPLFAVYGDGGAVAGFGVGATVTSTGASGTLSGVSYWHLGVNAEVTLGDHFYIAAGPHFASAAWGSVTGSGGSGGGSASVGAAAGPMPALDLRLGFMTGSRRPNGSRKGFSVGLDAMALFAFNAVVATGTGNNTGGSVDVQRGLVVGLAPTLTLGFDSM